MTAAEIANLKLHFTTMSTAEIENQLRITQGGSELWFRIVAELFRRNPLDLKLVVSAPVAPVLFPLSKIIKGKQA